jgi:hypothetical protein
MPCRVKVCSNTLAVQQKKPARSTQKGQTGNLGCVNSGGETMLEEERSEEA